ncbi:MAG: 50S ribosomal protein L30e [Methanobacteriota archaeon]
MVELEKIERTLKNVVSKGKVQIGAKQTKTAMQNKTAKLVIIAKNSPYSEEITKIGKENKIPLYNADLNSVDLGYACGKNFSVSVFAVLDDGDTNVMQLIKKKVQK